MDNSKLLFLGADTSTEDAVKYAQSLGVYTIVTDYRQKEKVPAKLLADEAWMIDVADMDALEHRSREEGVTAVFAGNHEFCLDQCKELCARLGLPFYASDDGWKASRDKIFYKEICEECGLAVPKWIRLKEDTAPEKISQLHFPLVIKPTDSCAGQGISVIRHPDEVKEAYRNALAYSAGKEVIAEEFIDGDEMFIGTYVHEGKMMWMGRFEFFSTDQVNKRRAHFGRFNPQGGKETIPGYAKVTRRLGCKEGECLFQCVYKDGILYNLELGYRLDGVRSWRQLKPLFGISPLELMVDYALGITHEGETVFGSLPADGLSICYYLWTRPGQIERITGLKELYARDDLIFLLDNYREGGIVRDQDNMRSIAYMIVVCGSDDTELAQKIRQINETLHMYNTNGNDMLIHIDNFSEVWKSRMTSGIYAANKCK